MLLDQPLQDPPAALLAAAFQLSCWEPEAGAYLALPLQAVEVDSLAAAVRGSGGGGSSGRTKALLLIAEQLLPSAEWQVSWELPAGTPAAAAACVSAPEVLQRLRVNPRGLGEAAAAAASSLQRQLRLPPPLAGSLTVVLTAEGASLALLAPAPLPLLHGHQAAHLQRPAPASLLETAAVLHLGGLKAALHTYPAPEGCTRLAADIQAHLALCLPDSSSATAPPGAAGTAAAPGVALLEPTPLDCAVEYCTAGGGGQQPGQQPEHEAGGAAGDAGEGEDAAAGGGGGARGSAALPATFWQAAAQQTELAVLALRPPPWREGLSVQAAAEARPLVVNASEASLAELGRVAAALAAPATPPAAGQPDPAATAAAAAPLLLVNHSGGALRLRQRGAQHMGQLLLQDGQRLPLVWPAPPALVPGATRQLELASAAAAEDDESAWSQPLDVR